MLIQRINQNAEKSLQLNNNTATSPNFTGNLKQQITNSLPHKNSIARMESLKWLKGEIGGILITALGTGLVAPIFIGFNPFVKAKKNATPEEKKEVRNTKLYTAMRQPISAALAILFQASVQKYIDRFLDAKVNNPENSKHLRLNLDQCDLNTETYIKRNIAEEMKNEGKTKPSFIRALFGGKELRQQRKDYDKLFTERVKARQNEQLQKIADYFTETGKIKIGERFLENETVADLVNKEINGYIADAVELQKTPAQHQRYLERAEVLIKNEDYLKEIFKEIPINEIKKTQDPVELKKLFEQTETVVRDLLGKETNPEVKQLLQEMIELPEDLRANRASRTLDRIKCIKKMCGGEYSSEKYFNAMLEKKRVLEERITQLEGCKIKNPKGATEATIKEALRKIAECCHFKEGDGIIESVLKDTDTFDKDLKGLLKKVGKDITKGYKALVEKSYKGVNQVTKILVGVFITLPITCTALNWIYPRFMDLFFPNLAGTKKAADIKKNGGNK